MKDIGKVEYMVSPSVSLKTLDGYPASFIAINQKSGSNAVQVASDVEAVIADFEKIAPPGILVSQFDDKKSFVNESIENVSDALGLAVVLVLVTLLLFLKNWRTVLIPALAIPVAIVGTFLFLGLFGFSLNFLTLTGLVLATGLVVDDAILVVESVSKKIDFRDRFPLSRFCQKRRTGFGYKIYSGLCRLLLKTLLFLRKTLLWVPFHHDCHVPPFHRTCTSRIFLSEIYHLPRSASLRSLSFP